MAGPDTAAAATTVGADSGGGLQQQFNNPSMFYIFTHLSVK
jgi:hypothetical protein